MRNFNPFASLVHQVLHADEAPGRYYHLDREEKAAMRKRIVAMIKDGQTAASVSARFGIPRATISTWVKHSFERKKQVKIKVTPEYVEKTMPTIIKMRNQGASYGVISVATGISRSYLANLIRRHEQTDA